MTATDAAPTPAVLARRWFEDMWNRRDRRLLEEIMAPDVVGWAEGGQIIGREAWVAAAFETFLGTFPDLQLMVDGTVAEGNEVVVRWHASGTHTGGALGLAPTGLKVRFRGMTWLRFVNGRLVEGADSWNQAALVQALGCGRTIDSVQVA